MSLETGKRYLCLHRSVCFDSRSELNCISVAIVINMYIYSLLLIRSELKGFEFHIVAFVSC